MKKCSTCLKEKDVDCFYTDSRQISGKNGKCIDCTKKYFAIYRKSKRENINAYNKKYKEKDKELTKKRYQEDYKRNKDKFRERSLRWRMKNKDK